MSGWVTDFISSFGLPAVAILMVLSLGWNLDSPGRVGVSFRRS
jgi:hypothetical protein